MLDARKSPGQIVRRSRMLDSWMRYLTDSPTAIKFTALFKQADQGDIGALAEMQLEMERKSAHLQGVSSTRRRALTALEWTIEPDESFAEDALAKEAADYCRETLKGIDSWRSALSFLSTAIGPNVAVVEILWDRATPVGFVEVPGHRLRTEWYTNSGVFIETDDEPMGISTSVYGKFIVHHAESQGGFPFRKTLTHASAWPYLMIHFNQTDWASFNELYGIPMRFSKTTDASVDFDRNEVQDMLEQMGSDTAATFPAGIEPGFLQVPGKGETFEAMMNWAEKTLSILWLGQTLTTEVGDKGSFAAAKVHDNVRADLLASDIQVEAATIQDQLFRPMVRMRFPGRDVPIPLFKRKLVTNRDIDAERLSMDKFSFLASRGLHVDDDEVYRALDIPRPTELPDEKATSEQEAATFNELTLAVERAIRAGDLDLVNAIRAKIAALLGTSLKPLVVLPSLSAGIGTSEAEGEGDNE